MKSISELCVALEVQSIFPYCLIVFIYEYYGFVARATQMVALLERGLLTLPEHLKLQPALEVQSKFSYCLIVLIHS